MCGISGILNYNPDHSVNERLLLSMRDIMQHRGPDDDGLYLNRHVGMTHRRLSIIDLSSGHQPMTNEDGSVWIVYNGEIYNYLDLREQLVAKGHEFKTKCDTEVILHAYEEFGTDCLNFLRGMFAFAIWDENDRQLFAARDRLGIKPFYYCSLKDSFIFSSEIESILLDPRVERTVSETSLYFYLNLRYVPGPRTMFANIWKLQPGHYILIRGDEPQIKQYWDVGEATSQLPAITYDDTELEEQFLQILLDCVGMRLMSEVPLGVFLSGGIDSSMVVALMSKLTNQRIKTFSVGYRDDYGTNEFEYARLIARQYDTEHHELPISSHNFYDFLPKLVWHLDEPISDPATIPLYYLPEYSQQHVTVVLSGEGADEILAGYYIYKKMLLLEKVHQLPRFLKQVFIHSIAGRLFRNGKINKYLKLLRLPLQERYKGVSRAFMPDQIENQLRSKTLCPELIDEFYRNYYSKVEDFHPLNQMLYIDTKTWLPDDLLMKADKMTMAASQELRVPFLDHKLVEFAFSMKPDKKIRGSHTKILLKKLARTMLPETVVKRTKKGFPVPISKWFEGDLNQFARETMLDGHSACRRFFEIAFVETLFDEHRSGLRDHSETIWNLLVFEFWYESFIRQQHATRE